MKRHAVTALLATLPSLGLPALLDACAQAHPCQETATCPIIPDADPEATSGDGGADGSLDPLKPPPDAPFSFEAIPTPPRIVQGTSLKIPLKVVRSSPQNVDDITITVSNLPTGVTVDPLMIGRYENAGELVVHVAATVKHGPFEVTVEGKAASKTASIKLPLFVRGKPGTVDTTFGTNGRKLSVLGAGVGGPGALLVGPHDEVYVVGTDMTVQTVARVVRLTASGGNDPTYFGGAVASIGVPFPKAAVLDAAGRVVLGGGVQSTSAVIGRLLSTGQVDTSFAAGNGGSQGVTKALDANVPAGEYAPSVVGVWALTVAPGDTLYAAYQAGRYAGIAKLDSLGNRVTAFEGELGAPGLSFFRWAPETLEIAGVHADGAAITFIGGWERPGNPPQHGLGIARVTAFGKLDTTFTGDGWESFPRPGVPITCGRSATLRLPDGRWLAGFGEAAADGPSREAYLVMFAPDGARLDTAFGISGRAVIANGYSVCDVGRQADGKLLALVEVSNGKQLVRLTPTGTLDRTFANSGVFEEDAGTSPLRIAHQSDGRILTLSAKYSVSSALVTRIWD